MFESKRSQIFIAHQKEGIDQTQKSFLVGEKSSPKVPLLSSPVQIIITHLLQSSTEEIATTTKTVETGIILLINQVVAVFFLNKQ